jgi:hypothetical protein
MASREKRLFIVDGGVGVGEPPKRFAMRAVWVLSLLLTLGKSTVLDCLSKRAPDLTVLKEPARYWSSFSGENLLRRFCELRAGRMQRASRDQSAFMVRFFISCHTRIHESCGKMEYLSASIGGFGHHAGAPSDDHGGLFRHRGDGERAEVLPGISLAREGVTTNGNSDFSCRWASSQPTRTF